MIDPTPASIFPSSDFLTICCAVQKIVPISPENMCVVAQPSKRLSTPPPAMQTSPPPPPSCKNFLKVRINTVFFYSALTTWIALYCKHDVVCGQHRRGSFQSAFLHAIIAHSRASTLFSARRVRAGAVQPGTLQALGRARQEQPGQQDTVLLLQKPGAEVRTQRRQTENDRPTEDASRCSAAGKGYMG